MRILFSLTYYSPYVSGLTIIVKRLAEELAKRGYETGVLCMKHQGELADEEKINGVNVIRAKPLVRVSKGFLSWDWIVLSWDEVKKSRTIFINLPQPEGALTAIMAKVQGKMLIANYLAEVSGLMGFGLRATNLVVLALADKIVTYSEEYARYAGDLRFFREKTVWIYPPVPVPRARKKWVERLRKEINRKDGDLVVGVAARLAEDKGLEYLFEAIPLIRQWSGRSVKIVVAGPKDAVGEENYVRRISEMVEKYAEEVVFLGTVPEAEMGSFYSLIDVLACPSILEAFGLAQVEAMMMGVPVVSSELPGSSVPIKRTGMGVLIPPRDPQALANAILRVLKDRENFNELSSRAKKIFNLGKVLQKWQKLVV